MGEWLANDRRLPPATGGTSDLTLTELIAAYWKFAAEYYVKDGSPMPPLPSKPTMR